MTSSKSGKTDLSEFRFDIDASIVFQLGENLITSVVQAVVELVKNSYDADASYCRLEVATKNRAGDLSRNYSGAQGVVVIEDDGDGMTPSVIERGFLVISNSLKREMKRKNQTTKRGRTPLGDKGLGRLSAQRLADNVEIFTKPVDSDTEYYVGFSWKDFVDTERLSQVELKTGAWPSTRKKGTKLVLSGLREPEAWQGDAITELQDDLSRMISPYKDIVDFTLLGTVDGIKLEFREFAEKLRETAQLRYKVDFNEKRIHFIGKAKLDYLYPDNKEDKLLFKHTVLQDDGQAFLEFLCALKGADRFQVRPCSDDGWFIEYEHSSKFEDVDKLKLVSGKRANPGPFKGEIDGFDLGGYVAGKVAKAEFSIFDSDKEYRETIKTISGIRVYRDGFGVRVDRDWLGLGKQWTSAASYYTLRPENTIGYIAISARDNKQLEETTDREGFRVTPHYENFVRLMQEFVKFSADAQEFVRRGWLKFRDNQRKKHANIEPDAPPEAVSHHAHRKISKAETVKGSLSSAKSAIAQTTGSSKAQLKKKLQTVEAALTTTEKYIDEVSSVKKDLEAMDSQILLLREQMAQMYETVSLGITAEALSHEIKNITDNLAGRNRKISKYIQEKQIKDSQIVAHIEHINSTVTALRKQLSHLAPSLRFVREKREVISLPEFCNGIPEFYRGRMERADIDLIIEPSKGRKFEIFMNLGKLNQIIDNLILNSEYWIKEDMRLGQLEHGELHIQLDKPVLRIWDNARGFDRAIETSLFTEPFITTKGAGKGRGLGLFIVNQLLDAERCSIELLPKKNKQGNRYILEIDFTGAFNA